MATTIDQLKWSFLTGLVNKMKSPNQFLVRLLWGNKRTLPTETIEIGLVEKAREVAPFVRKNGEALMVEGHTRKMQTVEAPNIRMKIPFTPSPLLYNRQPATPVFVVGGGEVTDAVNQHIARDMRVLSDMETNAQEYLASMALKGTISYQVETQDNFQISFPKPAGHTVTVSVGWDDATPANVKFFENSMTAKRLVSEEEGMQITHGILGKNAANAYLSLVEGGHIKALDTRRVVTGTADLTQNFTEDGAIYLGDVPGIQMWEYSRSATVNAVSTEMIRTDYVEWVAVTPAAEFVEYFGSIPDWDAVEQGLLETQRFSKSWKKEDPSVLMALLHSRPLPVPRRPGASVSMKVTNV